MTHPLTTDDVERAAADLVAAFARNDTDAYFAWFAPEATFVFHNDPRTRLTRPEYRAAWGSWLEDEWRVVECLSEDPAVQLWGDCAVFTHRVTTTTTVTGADSPERTVERETIVFARRDDGQLTAVHEHLSAPTAQGEA